MSGGGLFRPGGYSQSQRVPRPNTTSQTARVGLVWCSTALPTDATRYTYRFPLTAIAPNRHRPTPDAPTRAPRGRRRVWKGIRHRADSELIRNEADWSRSLATRWSQVTVSAGHDRKRRRYDWADAGWLRADSLTIAGSRELCDSVIRASSSQLLIKDQRDR